MIEKQTDLSVTSVTIRSKMLSMISMTRRKTLTKMNKMNSNPNPNWEAAEEIARLREKEAAWGETRRAVASLNNENGALQATLKALEAERDASSARLVVAEAHIEKLENEIYMLKIELESYQND
jgi:septal ring factor EnvC (AmiA/AmiB activator)